MIKKKRNKGLEWIRHLYETYREIFWYLVCGVGTTLVNLAVFWWCDVLVQAPTATSTAAAWLLSVIFAYITNRTFVFHSTNNTPKTLVWEILSFFGARVCSGVLDVVLMVVLVDGLHFSSMWTKIFVNVLVTVLNYLFSKWVIFRSGKERKHASDMAASGE